MLKHIWLFAALFALAACSDEEGVDGPVDFTLTDIVTYEGDDAQGHSVFSLIKVDDTPEVTLTSERSIGYTPSPDEGRPEHPRLLLSYMPESGKAYTSGPVTLRSASLINQGPLVTEWKEEYDAWNRDPVYLLSAWRSGCYLNFRVRLTYSRDPRLFCLAAAPSTLETAWPELYLVHILAEPTDYHDRAYYASFDISQVWNRPDVEGVIVHVNNSNLDKHIFTFTKTAPSWL